MEMAITARQISRARPLPVFTRYIRPTDRLQVSASFAEAIIAKYKASDEQELPSVSFVYPETAREASEARDRLASSLITLNRIRVRMNIHNHRWLQNYALSLENSCRILLQQLSVLTQAAPGMVPADSVRQLMRIFGELRESIAATSATGRDQAGTAEETRQDRHPAGEERSAGSAEAIKDGGLFRFEQEEETILRILTAASRGNGTRERYMSELYRRLQESASPESTDNTAQDILERAGTELFRIAAARPAVTGWASEEARQFFWRIQRAPEQERNLILQAGGHTDILALERDLRSMSTPAFHRFSGELMERISELPEISGTMQEHAVPAETIIERMSAEEWTQFTTELEGAGLVFRDGKLTEAEPEAFRGEGPASRTIREEQILSQLIGEKESRSQIIRNEETHSKLISENEILSEIHEENTYTREIEEEKRIVTEMIAESGEEAELLTRLLQEHTERTEILRENQAAEEALSEAVLNLTMEEWDQFRQELSLTHIKNSIPDSILAVFGDAGNGRQSADRAAADQLQKGMRMSVEKRELIRILGTLSRVPDASFRTLERVLREQTVLAPYSIRTDSRQYFRSLSARERENWTGFIMDLLQDAERTGIEPERVYLRIGSGRRGTAGISGLPGAGGSNGTDGQSGAEAAGAILEQLREARIVHEENAGYMDTPALMPADIDVPQRQSSGRAEAAAAAAAAAEAAVRETRTEYNDIEFETTTRRVEEHLVRESGRDMQEFTARLDAQQKEISQIRDMQERLANRNISGEILRKLGDRASMERLRGGR